MTADQIKCYDDNDVKDNEVCDTKMLFYDMEAKTDDMVMYWNTDDLK
jgi:hypothetical protein